MLSMPSQENGGAEHRNWVPSQENGVAERRYSGCGAQKLDA